jgi:hypothetical protein
MESALGKIWGWKARETETKLEVAALGVSLSSHQNVPKTVAEIRSRKKGVHWGFKTMWYRNAKTVLHHPIWPEFSHWPVGQNCGCLLPLRVVFLFHSPSK